MRIVISLAARQDIRAAHANIAERDAATAARFVQVISAAITGLGRFPLLGRPGIVPGTRERLLTRYPYKIVYEIDGETLAIDRVIHMAQQWPPAPAEDDPLA